MSRFFKSIFSSCCNKKDPVNQVDKRTSTIQQPSRINSVQYNQTESPCIKQFKDVFEVLSNSCQYSESHHDNVSFFEIQNSRFSNGLNQATIFEANYKSKPVISDIQKNSQREGSAFLEDDALLSSNSYGAKNVEYEGLLALYGPEAIKRFFREELKRRLSKNDNSVNMINEKFHERFTTVYAKELEFTNVLMCMQNDNHKFDSIKNLIKEYVIKVTNFVKNVLYKDRILELEDLLIEDGFESEFSIMIVIYEILFQDSSSALNKIIVSLLESTYLVAERDNLLLPQGFQSLQTLEGRIFRELLYSSNSNEESGLEKRGSQESLDLEGEIALVRTLIQEMQEQNRYVSDEALEQLVLKKYIDNIYVFKVLQAQRYNTQSNHSERRDTENIQREPQNSGNNIFAEENLGSISKFLDVFTVVSEPSNDSK